MCSGLAGWPTGLLGNQLTFSTVLFKPLSHLAPHNSHSMSLSDVCTFHPVGVPPGLVLELMVSKGHGVPERLSAVLLPNSKWSENAPCHALHLFSPFFCPVSHSSSPAPCLPVFPPSSSHHTKITNRTVQNYVGLKES